MKTVPKILCLVPALPSELKLEAVASVHNQTVPVDYLVILTKRNSCKNLPERLSGVLNDGIQGLNIKYFDYLLRIDADTILPNDFVEKHIALNVDVVGGEGYAQLIKMKFFTEKMDGHFNSYSDDTYTYYKAKSCGSISERVMSVEHGTAGASHNRARYDFYSGKLDYMIGYDPASILVKWLKFHISIPWILGYLYSLFTLKCCFEFAKVERSKNIKQLVRRMRL